MVSLDSLDFWDLPRAYCQRLGQHCAPDFDDGFDRLMITGVSAITRGFGRSTERHGVEHMCQPIAPQFQGFDYVHLSHEVSMAEPCSYATDPERPWRFCAKVEHMRLLKLLNVNVVELTGNHNLNYGPQAYARTLEWYEQNGMAHYGGGRDLAEAERPLVLTLGSGRRVAFLGYNAFCGAMDCSENGGPGANPYSPEKATRQIRFLKDSLAIDFVVVSVQLEERAAFEPSIAQRRILRHLADAGADLVFGSQAHQMNPAELRGKVPIFYGLGNFLFDQLHRESLRMGYLLPCLLHQGRLLQIRPTPIFADDHCRPTLAEGDRHKRIMDIFFSMW